MTALEARDDHWYVARMGDGLIAMFDEIERLREENEALTSRAADASLVRQLVDVNTRLASALERLLNPAFEYFRAVDEANAALDARLALTAKLEAEDVTL